MSTLRVLLSAVLLACLPAVARAASPAAYPEWKHAGSMWLLTTPEGADLPATAKLENFPVLVRLHADFFDFSQAKTDGSDLRLSTADGQPLAYEVEDWQPAAGVASVWVRVPLITGNSRQEIRIHWGNAAAASESSGKAVFNASNGYAAVWHLGAEVADATGTLTSKDVGTTPVAGVVGTARHLAEKKGVFCGDKIVGLPSGAAQHSTQAWFRAERPNTTLIAWGTEPGGRGSKVRMMFRSPPHVRIDSNFSDVRSESRLPLNEWVHVVHTYTRGQGKLYINGRLDGSATPILNIQTPAKLWLGGWYDNYDFVGDLDEVRLSAVERSADWVKLEYENQKPLQTLVGPIVSPGNAVVVSPAELSVAEGQVDKVHVRADGAQKVYWSVVRDGTERAVAVDVWTFAFAAGRVTGDAKAVLRVRAVYPDAVRTTDVPVTIREAIPEPEFTLAAPAAWDGRSPIEVEAKVTNADKLKAAGSPGVRFGWDASTFAVTSEPLAGGKLKLVRAQNSGKLTVTATVDNGGVPASKSVEIAVTEPATDPWVARKPADDERPLENQFYARDDKDEGTLVYSGKLDKPAEFAFLHVYADDGPFAHRMSKVGPDGRYAFEVKLKPGLVRYRVRFGVLNGGVETVLDNVGNLVCGDAYIINGQSNALATDWGKEEYTVTNPWVRTFGSTEGGPQGSRLVKWGDAVARGKGGVMTVGCWGMELGRRLVENHKVPVCLINGAVGGTRIDQHQRNAADPEDVSTIYGRLLWRVRAARLTHGVKAILWHQGENDQGADGPTGGFGFETYRRYFLDLATAWKGDYPNVKRYYVFQIWPKSCAMGVDGSDNRLREVQRTLPAAFSNLSVMSTLGVEPSGGCHYPPAGYAEIAKLIGPLLERDFYGVASAKPVTPADLKRARFEGAAGDRLVLEFDQPVAWDDALAGQFYLDGEKGKVTGGEVAGNRLTLKLAGPSKAKTVTYLDSKAWSQKTLLRGTNGIAALTFCEVPIVSGPSARNP
ncbi:MAG TPA: DUF2341 domain-containing protein [Humisphaera sp.]